MIFLFICFFNCCYCFNLIKLCVNIVFYFYCKLLFFIGFIYGDDSLVINWWFWGGGVLFSYVGCWRSLCFWCFVVVSLCFRCLWVSICIRCLWIGNVFRVNGGEL